MEQLLISSLAGVIGANLMLQRLRQFDIGIIGNVILGVIGGVLGGVSLARLGLIGVADGSMGTVTLISQITAGVAGGCSFNAIVGYLKVLIKR